MTDTQKAEEFDPLNEILSAAETITSELIFEETGFAVDYEAKTITVERYDMDSTTGGILSRHRINLTTATVEDVTDEEDQA